MLKLGRSLLIPLCADKRFRWIFPSCLHTNRSSSFNCIIVAPGMGGNPSIWSTHSKIYIYQFKIRIWRANIRRGCCAVNSTKFHDRKWHKIPISFYYKWRGSSIKCCISAESMYSDSSIINSIWQICTSGKLFPNIHPKHPSFQRGSSR